MVKITSQSKLSATEIGASVTPILENSMRNMTCIRFHAMCAWMSARPVTPAVI